MAKHGTDMAAKALAGEGNDRKYVVDGRAWRVRLRMISQRKPTAPVNGEPDLAPVSFCYGISVALLDKKDRVATDASGALLVFDQHSVSIDEDAMSRPDFDPAEAIDAAIAGQIAAASTILANKARLAPVLAAWAEVP